MSTHEQGISIVQVAICLHEYVFIFFQVLSTDKLEVRYRSRERERDNGSVYLD